MFKTPSKSYSCLVIFSWAKHVSLNDYDCDSFEWAHESSTKYFYCVQTIEWAISIEWILYGMTGKRVVKLNAELCNKYPSWFNWAISHSKRKKGGIRHKFYDFVSLTHASTQYPCTTINNVTPNKNQYYTCFCYVCVWLNYLMRNIAVGKKNGIAHLTTIFIYVGWTCAKRKIASW